jgi:hypothetical protein
LFLFVYVAADIAPVTELLNVCTPGTRARLALAGGAEDAAASPLRRNFVPSDVSGVSAIAQPA